MAVREAMVLLVDRVILEIHYVEEEEETAVVVESVGAVDWVVQSMD